MTGGQTTYYPAKIQEIIAKMKAGGAKKLHILTDFDKTLTDITFINGKQIPSTISQIRAGGYLGEEYSKLAYELFEKYSSFEHDQSLSKEERVQKMYEWYEKHHQILIKYKLNRNILDDIMEKSHLKLKNKVIDFLKMANKINIPVIIMSAGSGYMIQKQLEKEKVFSNNIYIVANFYDFDSDGYMTGTKGPLIHSANKSETTLHDFDFYEKIKDRTNIIQIGDVIDDSRMADGFEYQNLLSVGFCYNPEKEKNYADYFDIVLKGEDDFGPINNIIEQIV